MDDEEIKTKMDIFASDVDSKLTELASESQFSIELNYDKRSTKNYKEYPNAF